MFAPAPSVVALRGHGEHKVDPSTEVYESVGQSRHCEEPLLGAYLPAGHSGQLATRTELEAEPAAHGVHCKEFMSYAYVPIGQYSHTGSSSGSLGRGFGAGGAGGAGGAEIGCSGGGGGGLLHGGGGGGLGGSGGSGGGDCGGLVAARLVTVNLYISLACPFGALETRRITFTPESSVKYFIPTWLGASKRRFEMKAVDCRS